MVCLFPRLIVFHHRLTCPYQISQIMLVVITSLLAAVATTTAAAAAAGQPDLTNPHMRLI
jgi:hypothetical protein